MARIGILTYHFVPNYGAAMQAWALQKALVSLGHDVYFIDYRPSHLTIGGRFHLPVEAWTRRANLVIAYQKAMALKRMLRGDGGKQSKFEAFHQKYLQLDTVCYRTNRELRENPPAADVYICGSDQIWNASEQFGIDSSYFLDFAPAGIKRVSYAASFGRPYVHSRFLKDTSRLLADMDSISVREQSAVDLVHSMCEQDAVWVPDPTLLPMDAYPEAVEPDLDQEYIFSYTLRSRELVAQIEAELVRGTGLNLVSPATLAASRSGAPGPLEWLGYIKSSNYMVTNSYHGTLFSIIFQKPFVFVGLSGEKSGFNERAKSLLEGLGLSDRMMFDYDGDRLAEIMATPIDWAQVQKTVALWRGAAKAYIQSALI